MKNKALLITIVGILIATAAGIAAALIITKNGASSERNLIIESMFVAVVGLLLIILTVEIISVFKINDSTYHTALIAGFLIVLYAFSADMLTFFADLGIYLSKTGFAIVSEIAFVATTLCYCWYVKFLYELTLNKKTFIAISVTIGVLQATYIAANFFGYGYVVHFVIAGFVSFVFCAVLYNAGKKNEIGAIVYFMSATFALSVGAQSVNTLFYNECTATVPGISLVYAGLSFWMFLLVYFRFSIHAHKKAVKSNEYKHQAEVFETKALSGQIKPHFIFNSLEAVRVLYHQDIAVGDEALNHLSNFLRDSIHSFDNELIPFETELDNIFSFTEFENLKRKDKTDIIFNIDFTDFYVPPFSVQPFVENALRYSEVEKLDNGSIIISSYKSGDFAIVEIVDNGKGFDLSKVSENSSGIKNACGRFALTLGVIPEIESEAGCGTRIKIVIDLNKQGECNK